MRQMCSSCCRLATVLLVLAGLAWPVAAGAQEVGGQARAAQVTIASVFGTTTTSLSDTGSLSGPADARDASQSSGAVGEVLRGDTLHAAAIGMTDRAASEASIANVAVGVAGLTLGADFVVSRASAAAGDGAGAVSIEGLTINGIPVDVTGMPNQRVELAGALVVINEQRRSADGIVVNGLHVIVDGLADILVASAAASAR